MTHLLQFYDSLTTRLTGLGHTIDIFGGCYDQVGLYEMKNLANSSGGAIVLSDSFCSAIFKQSLYRLFERDSSNQSLKMCFNAALEIFMSKELKVSGLIGPAVSAQKKGTNVSEIEVGISGTNSWKLGTISPRSSYAIYFDLSSTQVIPRYC